MSDNAQYSEYMDTAENSNTYTPNKQNNKPPANNSNEVLDQWNTWKDSVNDQPRDLHDLAEKLGLKLGKGQSKKSGDRVYHSPSHDDKSPSLSIFKDGTAWKDHSTNKAGGDAISLYQYKTGLQYKDAVKGLAELYNVPAFKPLKTGAIGKQKSLAEFIADRVQKGSKQKATEYLTSRGISEAVINHAWSRRTIGWNDYTNPKHPAGESGHGGEGVSFIATDRYTQTALAVDTRYEKPELNGGIKTNSQGDKDGTPWVCDWPSFYKSHTVYIVESAINALSVLTAMPQGVSALATRGTATVENLPVDIFKGKMIYIAMDNDAAFADDHQLAGHRPGPEAGWKLYDKLSAAGISCMLIDQSLWEVGEDVNDILQEHGAHSLSERLKKPENAIIQGLQFNGDKVSYEGKPRNYLPKHDFMMYWRYRAEQDFTRYIAKYERDDEGEAKPVDFEDLAGFRIAKVSRVAIQSWQATVLNAAEGQGQTMFSIACQTPQHGKTLKRLTFTDEQYANPQHWGKFGYIYKPAPFMRMTNILSNTLESTEQLAVNYVGLAYKKGVPVINEGTDCYFKDAEKQCPYSDLIFNSGSKHHARECIKAFQATFKDNAALIPMVWALGAHLKLFLGFWPHLQMQAEKGSGKSVLMNKLARSLQMEVYGAQMLTSAFRLQKTVSYTGHPVMWEEVGTNSTQAIKEANDKLQEAYNYRINTRGEMQYLSSAPVLLGGEEIDMDSLLGKLVRCSITAEKQGPEIRSDLPVFPMRQWLEFLAGMDRERMENALDKTFQSCLSHAASDKDDANAKRSIKNFACVRLAWRMLCDFAGIDHSQGGFERDLIKEMNLYLKETQASRHPWVWIMEIVLSEMDAGRWQYPRVFSEVVNEDGKREKCLLVRHTHIMDHLRHSSHLKDRFQGLPIRQAKSFLKQAKTCGVVVAEGKERKIEATRITGLTAFSLDALESYGLILSRTHDDNVIPEQDVPMKGGE